MSEAASRADTMLHPGFRAGGDTSRGASSRSVYKSSYLEALRYKWIASEKAGKDLGDGVIYEWLERHWLGWCRERWLEHLLGEVCWVEFGAETSGLLRRTFRGEGNLLGRVLEQIRRGWENLDIIIWASENGLDVGEVIEVLVIADINRPSLKQAQFFEGGA